ncbi:hypothetical protein [Pleionea sp. CnH1-48]|uniref:hypothetical protein n=1 Tax=Pleionea sp. CnH1-48 TaxID=2954494 RepID=UPI0020972780|nr:hypothetical protein [Pleionea sp. CnH1-48]MCO7226574.1 hypothetical protein [Pleionea sp. CnH1-48]
MSLIKTITTIAFTFSVLTSFAEEHKHHHHHTSPIEGLSPELRQLLGKEMRALQGGMQSIIPAYISGDWEQIAKTAHKMKNSYILKQSLTDAQIKELHHSLPKSFLKQDHQFHYLAGMLEHAAKHKKPELVNFYFSEMNEACVSCHTDFATHRFPKLKKEEKGHHH